jgi:hypothetical protein
MPFLPGRMANPEELTSAGPVLDAVADALAHMACAGLVYVDLRVPNVIVPLVRATEQPAAWLVDYDDVCIADGPLSDSNGLRLAIDAAAKALFPGDDADVVNCKRREEVNYLQRCPAVLFAVERAFERRVKEGAAVVAGGGASGALQLVGTDEPAAKRLRPS